MADGLEGAVEVEVDSCCVAVTLAPLLSPG